MSKSYPVIPHDKKKSTRFTLLEIEEIKRLFNTGININKLSKIYKCNYGTIKYWVNEEFRNNTIKRTSDRKMMIYNSSLIEKKKMNTIRKFQIDARRKVDVEFNEYEIYRRYKTYNSYKKRASDLAKIRYLKNKIKVGKMTKYYRLAFPEQWTIINNKAKKKHELKCKSFMTSTTVRIPRCISIINFRKFMFNVGDL